jgi:hypothetical protein
MPIPSPSTVLDSINPEAIRVMVHQSVPQSLLRKHPGIVETAVCAILLQQGCDDDALFEPVSGCNRDQAAARVTKVLLDTPASVCLFSMLDRYQERSKNSRQRHKGKISTNI